ncbi:MAG: type II secretion system protein F [Actinobacteria bacterium]|jgi:tight adherence protein B|nr:type II secretion system protein F [Actinomycetota bacterium]NBO35121.1 type II secretion system protein F [Actinomycetota bacterium]
MGLIVGVLFAIGMVMLWGAMREPLKFRGLRFNSIPRFFVYREKLPQDVWPDVVDDLASAIRAGLSLPQAVAELCNSGPEQLRPTFKLCRDRYQTTGDFSASLNLIANSLEDSQADKFVASLQVAHEVGGADLGVLLRTLSEVMREELILRGEIVARQSWTVNGAKLAVAAPWVTALVLSTRESAANVYLSGNGIRMLTLCALVSLIAYVVMMKIAKLPVEKRLLA